MLNLCPLVASCVTELLERNSSQFNKDRSRLHDMSFCDVLFYFIKLSYIYHRAEICYYSVIRVKQIKYLLTDEDFFSLNFGCSSPFDWSLFTDTELDTRDPDLTLMTQRTEREKHFTTRGSSISYEDI